MILPYLRSHSVSSRVPPVAQWIHYWQFWALLGMVIPGGGILLALTTLLRLPGQPNCNQVFLPTVSVSERLFCAQDTAKGKTLEKFLTAFSLVEGIPANHPLRSEINRAMEQWSSGILEVAEARFQEGNLTEAISIAQSIPIEEPNNSHGKELGAIISSRVQTWQTIWTRAEVLYQQAESEIATENWHQAFLKAVRLLTIGNTYWETTRYEQLTSRIQVSKDEGSRLTEARRLATSGSADDVLAAIKLMQTFNPESPLYPESQKLIPQFSQRLLDLAQGQLDQKNRGRAQIIVQRIPVEANLGRQIEDFNFLADAQSMAWGGTTVDIERAIAHALKLGIDRPFYSRAQQLILRWQLEIIDVSYLQRAQLLANGKAMENLKAALIELSMISPGNPRFAEAQKLTKKWQDDIEVMEDQPYLTQAERYAALGTVPGFQAAIASAIQVGADRSLYSQARQQIRQWSQKIQQLEDQPLLNQARESARQNDFRSAITIASRVSSGRVLFESAQADIRTWNGILKNQQALREAKQLALPPATAQNLGQAMAIADQVPANSELRAEANLLIRQWSQDLLTLAQNQADKDLVNAITIARKIPPSSEFYQQAQRLIQGWRQR